MATGFEENAEKLNVGNTDRASTPCLTWPFCRPSVVAQVSQRDLARKLHTSQQQISRLESPSYEGHSLSMLRRVAGALGATVHVTLTPRKTDQPQAPSDGKVAYKTGKKS